MAGEKAPWSFFLCRCGGAVDRGLDLEALGAALRRRFPGAEVSVAGRLCEAPGPLTAAARRGRRVAVGACRGEQPLERLREAAAAGGADGHGMPAAALLELAEAGYAREEAGRRAELALAGCLGRAAAYPGVHPENLSLRLWGLDTRMSRRALLRLPRGRHQVVPRVVGGRCAADRGCRLCRGSCAWGALEVTNRGARVIAEKCRACGVCAAACPFGAVSFPTQSPEELEAEAAALLEAARGTVAGGAGAAGAAAPETGGAEAAAPEAGAALVFVCEARRRQGADGPLPPAFLEVRVPCLALVRPQIILRSLARGAAGVVLAGACGGCRQRAGGALALWAVRQARAALGPAARRVRFVGQGERIGDAVPEPLEPPAPQEPPVLGPPAAGGGVRRPWSQGELAALVLALGGGAPAPEEMASSFRGVAMGGDGCTLCGVCAGRCPAGALAVAAGDGEERLEFDAGICTGCGLCVTACPERVLRLRGLDAASVVAPPRVLARAAVARCRRCGRILGPAALLAVGARARGAGEGVLCPHCAMARQVTALRPPVAGARKP